MHRAPPNATPLRFVQALRTGLNLLSFVCMIVSKDYTPVREPMDKPKTKGTKQPDAPNDKSANQPRSCPRSHFLTFGGNVPKDRFQFQELLQPRLAPLPAVAGLFITTEQAGEINSSAVDANVTGANSLGYLPRMIEFPRSHVAR